MKPKYHGGLQFEEGGLRVQKTIVKTEKINTELLMKSLANLESSRRKVSEDEYSLYIMCSVLYQELFKDKGISAETSKNYDFKTLEIAMESIEADPEVYFSSPQVMSGSMNYFYEYCRSIAVAEMFKNAPEHLDEEDDFI